MTAPLTEPPCPTNSGVLDDLRGEAFAKHLTCMGDFRARKLDCYRSFYHNDTRLRPISELDTHKEFSRAM